MVNSVHPQDPVWGSCYCPHFTDEDRGPERLSGLLTAPPHPLSPPPPPALYTLYSVPYPGVQTSVLSLPLANCLHLHFPWQPSARPRVRPSGGHGFCRTRACRHSLRWPGAITPSNTACLLSHHDLSPTCLTFSTADNTLQLGLVTSYHQARMGSNLCKNFQIKVLGTLLPVIYNK